MALAEYLIQQSFNSFDLRANEFLRFISISTIKHSSICRTYRYSCYSKFFNSTVLRHTPGFIKSSSGKENFFHNVILSNFLFRPSDRDFTNCESQCECFQSQKKKDQSLVLNPCNHKAMKRLRG